MNDKTIEEQLDIAITHPFKGPHSIYSDRVKLSTFKNPLLNSKIILQHLMQT